MPAEDMTTGEIARALKRIEDGQAALSRDLVAGQADLRRELTERLAQVVPTQVYQLQHQAVRDEITELQQDLGELRKDAKETEAKRGADRKWWITAILIPIASLVLTYLVPLLSGGGAT